MASRRVLRFVIAKTEGRDYNGHIKRNALKIIAKSVLTMNPDDDNSAHLIGRTINLPGHFEEPVLLEAVRPLGSGVELRVRRADGQLEETVLSETEFRALAAIQFTPAPEVSPSDPQHLRWLTVILNNIGNTQHDLLHAVCRHLPTDYEPYGKRERNDADCSCGCKLADPYFAQVPSLKPEAKKTTLAFHAKDDVPEVRREIFSLLRAHPLRFFAVVRDKRKVVEYVRQRNERDADYRYSPSELYDSLVRRLFKTLLHKDDAYNITFAKRGNADRTAALRQALEIVRQRFAVQWNIVSNAPIHVIPGAPPESLGLQVADYFLWGLQRLYERREGRYVNYLWNAFRLVPDVDDTRAARYGVFYTQKKPLSTAALPDLPGI